MSESTFQVLEKPVTDPSAGNTTIVLALIGSADVSAGQTLDRELVKVAGQRPGLVVFDLSQLQYISSVCLSVLLHFRTTAQGWGGRVKLAAPNDMIGGTLRHALLDKVLPIEPSVALALAAD